MSWFNPAVLATGNSVTAAIWNNNFGNMADSGWVALSTLGYLNSWANSAGPASSGTQAGYRLIGNRVFLSGTVAGGASGTQVCGVLPVGYRPTYVSSAAGVTTSVANSACLVRVTTAGAISLFFASGGTPGFEISFTTD
jgi:hypothetical protein